MLSMAASLIILDDEPANGPDVYFILSGFLSAGLLPAMATIISPVNLVLRLLADEDPALVGYDLDLYGLNTNATQERQPAEAQLG